MGMRSIPVSDITKTITREGLCTTPINYLCLFNETLNTFLSTDIETNIVSGNPCTGYHE